MKGDPVLESELVKLIMENERLFKKVQDLELQIKELTKKLGTQKTVYGFHFEHSDGGLWAIDKKCLSNIPTHMATIFNIKKLE